MQTRTVEVGPDRIIAVVEKTREDSGVDCRIVGLRVHQPRQAEIARHAIRRVEPLLAVEVFDHRADIGPVLQVTGLGLQGRRVGRDSRHGVRHTVERVLVGQRTGDGHLVHHAGNPWQQLTDPQPRQVRFDRPQFAPDLDRRVGLRVERLVGGR